MLNAHSTSYQSVSQIRTPLACTYRHSAIKPSFFTISNHSSALQSLLNHRCTIRTIFWPLSAIAKAIFCHPIIVITPRQGTSYVRVKSLHSARSLNGQSGERVRGMKRNWHFCRTCPEGSISRHSRTLARKLSRWACALISVLRILSPLAPPPSSLP